MKRGLACLAGAAAGLLCFASLLLPCSARAEAIVIPYPGTNGSMIDPFMESVMTNPAYWGPDGVKIVFPAGTFRTKGNQLWKADNNFKSLEIAGAGQGSTILALTDNAFTNAVGTARRPVFGTVLGMPGVYFKQFTVRDLTIDCNWRHQGFPAWESHKHGFKIGGIDQQCWQGLLTNVAVVNAIANGRGEDPCDVVSSSGGGIEAFPIRMRTINHDSSSVTITNCLVRDFRSLNGGYCTAIFVSTHVLAPNYSFRTDLPAIQPIAPGQRRTKAALIHGNRVVNCSMAIAYGCAHAEEVDFVGNQCQGVLQAFNLDTPTCSGITIRSNVFFCSYGINVGCESIRPSPVAFDRVTITSNRFGLYPGGTRYGGPSYAIRLAGGNSNTSISGNLLVMGAPDYLQLLPNKTLCDDPGRVVQRDWDLPSIHFQTNWGWAHQPQLSKPPLPTAKGVLPRR